MTSTIEQRQLQPSKAEVGHPPAWSVDSFWRYETLTFATLTLVAMPHFLWQDAEEPWLVQKWFFTGIVVADRILVAR